MTPFSQLFDDILVSVVCVSDTASRYCHENGTWEEKVDYSACMNMVNNVTPELHILVQAEHATIIYLAGYSLSLITLSVATWIFAHCRCVEYNGMLSCNEG